MSLCYDNDLVGGSIFQSQIHPPNFGIFQIVCCGFLDELPTVLKQCKIQQFRTRAHLYHWRNILSEHTNPCPTESLQRAGQDLRHVLTLCFDEPNTDLTSTPTAWPTKLNTLMHARRLLLYLERSAAQESPHRADHGTTAKALCAVARPAIWRFCMAWGKGLNIHSDPTFESLQAFENNDQSSSSDDQFRRIDEDRQDNETNHDNSPPATVVGFAPTMMKETTKSKLAEIVATASRPIMTNRLQPDVSVV